MAKRIYIDKYVGTLERTDLYLVKLTLKNGTVHEDLEPRRLFPFTNPDMYITLFDKDEHEIGFVRDLSELDKPSRQALESCFEEYYLIPKITRLLLCEERFGSIKWEVHTDRGPVKFRIRNRHSDIKRMHGSNRILVRDTNDNRYEIPDYTALDSKSIRMLFSYL